MPLAICLLLTFISKTKHGDISSQRPRTMSTYAVNANHSGLLGGSGFNHPWYKGVWAAISQAATEKPLEKKVLWP